MASMDGLDFLKDEHLDNQIKALLLQGVLEDRRFMRDATDRKRWWQNSPLVLAIVGIISVLVNGCIAYLQTGRTASDTLLLTQVKRSSISRTLLSLNSTKTARESKTSNTVFLKNWLIKLTQSALPFYFPFSALALCTT